MRELACTIGACGRDLRRSYIDGTRIEPEEQGTKTKRRDSVFACGDFMPESLL